MDRRWIVMAAVALGCEPLVPDGSAGTDGSSSGIPSESASSTESASTTANVSTAASVSTTANVSTTEGPSTTTTDATSTDDGDDTATGLDPATHWCQPSCETVTDCCITLLDDPTCVGMLGEYPFDFECEAGVCISNGCVDDEDCELNEVQDLRCVVDDARVPYCSPVCVDDGDCTAAGFAGFPCVDGICRDLPCVTDDECADGSVCLQYTGTCTFACQSDGDCASYGPCQPDGHCGCTADDECWDGLACVPM